MLCMHGKSLQSCPTLCNPIDGSPPGSSIHRILQARVLEWVAISFSKFLIVHPLTRSNKLPQISIFTAFLLIHHFNPTDPSFSTMSFCYTVTISFNLCSIMIMYIHLCVYMFIYIYMCMYLYGPPQCLSGKEPTCWCEFDPWVMNIPWVRKWQPTPEFLPGKAHGQRSLVGYSPWGCKESDTTEQLSTCICIHHYTQGTVLPMSPYCFPFILCSQSPFRCSKKKMSSLWTITNNHNIIYSDTLPFV